MSFFSHMFSRHPVLTRYAGSDLCIVPEIKRLIAKTLPRTTGQVEGDVAAWLQLNNMKAEKLQSLQLCSQNISTVWRKAALDALLASSSIAGVKVLPGFQLDAKASRSQQSQLGMMRFVNHEVLQSCISSLCDAVDVDVPTRVPISEPFSETLAHELEANSALVKSAAQQRIVEIVMQQAHDALQSSGAIVGGAKRGLNSEMTREKEREQEQQKQKQQQQQQETMFSRDAQRTFAWDVQLLGSSLAAAEDCPFYLLSSFSPRSSEHTFRPAGREPTVFAAVDPIAFPPTVLQSMNVAPFERTDATKPLRLKNVSVLLHWHENVAQLEQGQEAKTVILSLPEAESIRRLIQAKNGDEVQVGSALPDAVGLALVMSPGEIVIDATRNYPRHVAAGSLHRDRLCVSFYNSEFFFDQGEVAMLLDAVEASPTEKRRSFFEAAVVARRRSRKSWSGTPLRSVFAFADDDEYAAVLGVVAAVADKVREDGVDLLELLDLADDDGNGFLSHEELLSVFESLGLPAMSPAQTLGLTQLLDVDGDNAIEYAEFTSLFGSSATAESQLEIIANSAATAMASTAAAVASDVGASKKRREDRATRKQDARRKREQRLEQRQT